jgi:uncharacterized protein (TIGR02594 family)
MSKITVQYQWLEKLGPLPRVISIGLDFLGVQEVVGEGSNKTIIAWRDELNAAGVPIKGFSDDDIPWCGLFVAYVCFKAGKKVVKDPLWALNWANFGGKSSSPSLGDVISFKRPSGGHVGFYIGEDETCFHILGGNQSNKVSIIRIEKSRMVAARNQYDIGPPESAKPYKLYSAGGAISKNEA